MLFPDYPEFLASFQKLPPPGGYVTRLPGPPCADCGAAIFEVAHCKREAKNPDDGSMTGWETVDVQCGACVLVTARTVKGKRVIGSFDTATGRLTINGCIQ